MSSPYATRDNQPLEQWKVAALREELERRKLTTKGLKEDLLTRLDEAICIEQANEVENADNDVAQSDLTYEQAAVESVDRGKGKDVEVRGIDLDEKLDAKPEHKINDHVDSLGESKVVEMAEVETTVLTSEEALPNGKTEVRDSVVVLNKDGLPPSLEDVEHEPSDPNVESSLTDRSITAVATPSDGIQSTVQMEIDDSKCLQEDSCVLLLKHQVSEIDHPNLGFQLTSDSLSTASFSIFKKNELKVDVITDNVQLELDGKHEMVQQSSIRAIPCNIELYSVGVEEPLGKRETEVHNKDVEEPLEKKILMELRCDSNAENGKSLKNIDCVDLSPAEKLSLDRSSGDDSVDKTLESNRKGYKSGSNKTSDSVENSEMSVEKEDGHANVVGCGKPVELKDIDAENKSVSVLMPVKRKFHDKESVGHNDTGKKAHRFKTESSKASKPQSSTITSITPPKGLSKPTFKCFSGSDPEVNEAPTERIVPPPLRQPTYSLRIDHFLRPFTLKAVQELLGKTGTVTSFWMDHIKTHCYVSYSSVEEAIATRNAVYNIQWPPNGGHLLVAEFVDPQEVKVHAEAPRAPPATRPISTVPHFSITKTQPSTPSLLFPTQQVSKQQLPPPPSLLRGHSLLGQLNLPPPPPLPEKIGPPIITLDDLFRKTKATPCIYYLPLSDEQVAAKLTGDEP